MYFLFLKIIYINTYITATNTTSSISNITSTNNIILLIFIIIANTNPIQSIYTTNTNIIFIIYIGFTIFLNKKLV